MQPSKFLVLKGKAVVIPLTRVGEEVHRLDISRQLTCWVLKDIITNRSNNVSRTNIITQ
jgi:hypothetical protein